MSSTLSRLPGWVARINEVSGKMTNAGLHGLLDFADQTNRLGECLTGGQITSVELQAWINERMTNCAPHTQLNLILSSIYKDPKLFWEQMWSEILGKPVELPLFPKLKPKTRRAMERFDLLPIFLCEVSNPLNSHYREFAFISASAHRSTQFELGTLPGCWLLVEYITQERNSLEYKNRFGMDPLAREINLSTRLGCVWSELEEEAFPHLAKGMGLPQKAVRLPSARELNLIANVFHWLYWRYGTTFPEIEFGHEVTSTISFIRGLHVLVGGDRLKRQYDCRLPIEAVGLAYSNKDTTNEIGWRILVTLGNQ